MEGIIQSVKPDGDFKDNNVYEVHLQDGTQGKVFSPKGSYKDKKFASGEAIGEKMTAELNAKGNFTGVKLGDFKPNAIGEGFNGGSYKAKSQSYNGSDSRQTSIVRQSMLKASVDFLSGNPKAKAEHVLELAEKFEDWVNRVEASKPEEPEHFTRTQEQAATNPVGDEPPF